MAGFGLGDFFGGYRGATDDAIRWEKERNAEKFLQDVERPHQKKTYEHEEDLYPIKAQQAHADLDSTKTAVKGAKQAQKHQGIEFGRGTEEYKRQEAEKKGWANGYGVGSVADAFKLQGQKRAKSEKTAAHQKELIDAATQLYYDTRYMDDEDVHPETGVKIKDIREAYFMTINPDKFADATAKWKEPTKLNDGDMLFRGKEKVAENPKDNKGLLTKDWFALRQTIRDNVADGKDYITDNIQNRKIFALQGYENSIVEIAKNYTDQAFASGDVNKNAEQFLNMAIDNVGEIFTEIESNVFSARSDGEKKVRMGGKEYPANDEGIKQMKEEALRWLRQNMQTAGYGTNRSDQDFNRDNNPPQPYDSKTPGSPRRGGGFGVEHPLFADGVDPQGPPVGYSDVPPRPNDPTKLARDKYGRWWYLGEQITDEKARLLRGGAAVRGTNR